MIAEQLKRSILQAAIQGKLTEQRPEDGDARDLLREIQKEKARLIKEGKIKKENPLPEITEDEVPFDIPENWCWVRLNDICLSIIDGDHQPPPQASSGIPFLVISNLSNGVLSFENTRYVSIEYYKKMHSSRIANRGDVLFTVTGSYGIPVIVDCDEQFCFQRHIALLKTSLDCRFLSFWLKNPHVKAQCDTKATGTAQKTVGLQVLRNIIIPLPPLSEQRRIIKCIDEIFHELNKLETDEIMMEDLQKRFPQKMKDSILQNAIQGKLTEQNPEDGDARHLLKEIRKEKARLVKEGKIKKEKPLPEISEDEIPFDIPENWAWVRLGEIGEIIGGGTPKTEDKSCWLNGNIPWLTPADMKNIKGKYVERGERLITEYGLKNSSARLLPKGSVLFSSRAPIGYIAIANNSIATNQGFKSLVLHKNEMSEYVYYYLMAVTKEIEKMGSGTTFKEVSGAVIKEVLIPLPPIKEQSRIVLRLEEILPLCETLE